MKRIMLSLSLSLAAVLASVLAYAETYVVADLGTLPAPHNTSSGRALNNYGQVVGYTLYNSGSGTGGYTGHAFLWTLSNGMIDLGTLGGTGGHYGTGESMATGVNDSGQVVGWAQARIGGGRQGWQNVSRAFLWRDTNGNGVSDPDEMMDLLGQDNAYANAINAGGTVVGTNTGKKGGEPRPFRWQNGNWTYLRGLASATSFGTADAVNDSGLIAGKAVASDGWDRAVVWNGSTITALPMLPGGRNSAAGGINNSGDVVGFCYNGSPHAVLWRNGTALDLGFSGAQDINNQGQVVGGSYIWDAINGPRNLNTLLDPVTGAGWIIHIAYAINDNGQITGFGILNGVQRAFLLTPVP